MTATEAQALLDRCLTELPGDPDGIAELLAAADIAGVPGDPFECPLACWLRSRGLPRPAVTDSSVCVGLDEPRPLAWADTPRHAALFASRFDDGLYPRLAAD